MNSSRPNRLVATNAAVLALAGLASFILPKVAGSISDGPANLLIAMSQVMPILVAIPISCSIVGRAQSSRSA